MCEKIEGGDKQMIPFPEDRKAIDVGDFICDYMLFVINLDGNPK